LRRFTKNLAAAALAIGGGYCGAQMLASRPMTTPDVAGAASVGTDAGSIHHGSGDELILKSLDALERRPNIAARLRHSLRLGPQRLAGEGQFWQQGLGNQRRTRWEVKTLVDGDELFVTQVYDGEDVWTDRKLLGVRKTSRIDVAKVRRELRDSQDAAGQGGATPAEAPLELMARGGVSQLIAALHRSFTFGPARILQRGHRTVHAVIGHWRPEPLEQIWPSLSTKDSSEWPTHMPHHVLVYIDNDDRFPYVIECRGGAQAGLATSSAAHFPAHDPLARFEFIDVRFASVMPASLFQFTPVDANYHDVTRRVIDQLRPPAAPTPDANTARRQGTWR